MYRGDGTCHSLFYILIFVAFFMLIHIHLYSSQKKYFGTGTRPWVRLSPFPRVESRFNTHNQNAFANAFRNAFFELLRLSSISQNHDYEYTVRPRKTDPWNKGMMWPSAGMAGVYDCYFSHTFIVKYDHYAFEWCIAEVPPVMHHWAALFSGLNVRIHLFHFKEGR